MEYVKNPLDIDSAVDELVNFQEVWKSQGKNMSQRRTQMVRFENSDSDADEGIAEWVWKNPYQNPSF